MIQIDNVEVYATKPAGKIKGGLIVVHEVWGLTDHIKEIADRFAKEGYLVYAPDLISGSGMDVKLMESLQKDLFNPETRNNAQPKLREMMAPIQSPEYAHKTTRTLINVFSELYEVADVEQKVAVIGYCFGGTYSYNLAIKEPKLIAAIPYYGHCDHSIEELEKIQAPIQAFYGEKDEALVRSLPELETKMDQAKVDFNYQLYTNCGHAFFNDTNPFAYNKQAANDSWKRTLEFLDSKFKA